MRLILFAFMRLCVRRISDLCIFVLPFYDYLVTHSIVGLVFVDFHYVFVLCTTYKPLKADAALLVINKVCEEELRRKFCVSDLMRKGCATFLPIINRSYLCQCAVIICNVT